MGIVVQQLNKLLTCIYLIFRRHLDLHSGKRPFKCKLCGYTALKASMVTVRHYRIFHLEDGVRDVDTLAVDETELEQMREFSTREFLNLTPATNTGKKMPNDTQQEQQELNDEELEAENE